MCFKRKNVRKKKERNKERRKGEREGRRKGSKGTESRERREMKTGREYSLFFFKRVLNLLLIIHDNG